MHGILEYLILAGCWIAAGFLVRVAPSKLADELDIAIKQHLTFQIAHPFFRMLRADRFIPLSSVWLAVFVAGFMPVLILSSMEGTLFRRDGTGLTFFGAIADPLNYALLGPSCVVVAVCFVRSTSWWLYSLYRNLLSVKPAVKADFSRWIENERTGPAWRAFISLRVFVLIAAGCTWFPALVYLSIGRRFGIYGINGGWPTPLGWCVIVMLGFFTITVTLSLIIGIWTLFRFQRAYRKFGSAFVIRPFHPDGSGGMLFAGHLAIQLVLIFLIAALMVFALIVRDRVFGITALYHLAVPFLFGFVAVLAGGAAWAPHVILSRAKDKWVRELETMLPPQPPLGASPAAQVRWIQQSREIRNAGKDHPTWPLNLREGISLALSVFAALFMAILTSILSRSS